MTSDPALSGYGVVRAPGLFLAPNNTVVANLSGAVGYPTNTPVSELAAAIGTLSYQGTWNASTNTPTITSGVGTNGYYYVVDVAGTTNIDGISSWDVGDWIIFNSTAGEWQQIASGVISNAEINTALGNPISLGVGFSTAGLGAITLTTTGVTSLTLPTTGTVATTAGSLQVANNLSDLANATTARTNLGLGSAAQQNTSAFLQTANNLSDVPTPATARTNLGLGTAATRADSYFAQTANNLSDLANASTARTNLGLGTAATQATTFFAQVANNLSDLANASTARTNLGLGTAAVQNVGAFAQTANNLSDLISASTARGNLGLGTSAIYDVGTGANNIVQLTAGGILPAVDGSQLINLPAAGGGLLAANNLSDVASASTSRTNLGLGTAAVQNVGTFAQVANNLSDLASVATARTNLKVNGLSTNGDSIYTIQSTDVVVALTATLTAPRVWTLPAANSVNAGQSITIIDLASGVSTTNYIAITRAGADTINGTTAVNFVAPYGRAVITSNGSNAWEVMCFAAVSTSGSAADLTAGTLPSARLSGSYTGVTGLGTVTTGTWNATAIGVAYGGTNQTTYTIGDLLQASASTTLSKLAAVATGNVLISGGVGTVSSWGKVGLTTHVSGILPVANGGTNNAFFTISGPATSAKTYTVPNANCTILTSNAAVTVAQGGTGATTLTGVLKGNGTSAFTAATAGTDFVAPGTATTFTARQTFNGSTSVLASTFVNASETTTISATAATGTINYDVTTQSVLYYTSSAAANWTVNFRASSGTSLNTAMSTGDTVTVVFMVTQGGTAYYNSAVQVDGGAVTPKWQGGTAPSAGNVSSVDVYTYVITKTGAATFTVFASQTKFA